MPRRNRPRKARGRGGPWARRGEAEAPGGQSARAGWSRVETRHGVSWHVRPMTAERALKSYVCPGCGRAVEPGTGHLVVWRAQGVLGDAADLAGRRHWHAACWRVS
ncbi:MAG TPA: hypothetical protein VFQ96_00315 [Microbacteriaceae bacterium]|nr:hypothetical protein [Microbacteriaceae bacterium]